MQSLAVKSLVSISSVLKNLAKMAGFRGLADKSATVNCHS